MTVSRAPYMEWARHRPRPGVDLAGSNLLACSLDDLPGAREALDIAGESPDGYPPLIEAISLRYGVTPDRVAMANGCSGANFLACAAVLETGDEVLMERPAYDPLIAAAIGPMTRLIVFSNPHNPSGALASPESLEALARAAGNAGIPVLVDEVYQDTVLEGRRPPAAVSYTHLRAH